MEDINAGQEEKDNLTQSTKAKLEGLGIEVIVEHSGIIFAQMRNFKNDHAIVLLFNRNLFKGEINKPIIIKDKSSDMSLSEIIEEVATTNPFRDILSRYPNLKFSRSLLSALKIGAEQDIKKEIGDVEIWKDQMPGTGVSITDWLLHVYGLGGESVFAADFCEIFLKNSLVVIVNVPDPLQERAEMFGKLGTIWGWFIEGKETAGQIDKKREERALNPVAFLDDNELFEKECENAGNSSARKILEREAGNYENLRKALIDYRDNFYPQKFQEMAELRDEINNWLISLKPAE